MSSKLSDMLKAIHMPKYEQSDENAVVAAIIQNISENENGIFNCQFCSYITFHKVNFEAHLQSHNGDRPFKCTMCNKGFTQKHNLQYHMMIHQGVKPFQCQVCKQGFRQRYSLKLHQKKYDH